MTGSAANAVGIEWAPDCVVRFSLGYRKFKVLVIELDAMLRSS